MVTFLWRTIPRRRKALAVALALAWLLFAYGLFAFMFDESSLRETGTEATAEVLRFRDRGRNPDYADIRFTTRDGTIVETEVDVEDARNVPEAGDTIEVRYNPEAPSKEVVIAEVHQLVYWVERIIWMPLLLGLSGLIVARAAGFQIRRRGR
ncbi:MAG: DUF3592 domain-containing protein, partial [Actinobacteria bacterium]|nr:DUF3592 domain-containing protein [Actinomycetota bacterium]